MVSFKFNIPPYAECKGKWYSIGDTIEEPAGTPVIFYGNIERIANGATREEAQLVVTWDGYVQGTSEFFWFSIGETWALLTGEVPIPDSEKDAAFYVFPRGGTVQHDPRCCITLKPTIVPPVKATVTTLTLTSSDTLLIDEEATFEGKLEDEDGATIPYRYLNLRIGDTWYEDVITTDENGEYTYVYVETEPKTLDFQTSFTGEAGTYAYSKSPVRTVTWEESILPSLTLVPTLTTLTVDEELCPEVECETGIDDVCIYIDGVKTANCANSGLLSNITCIPDDFDKISGASIGIGTHTLQAKSPNAADSNVVTITVTEEPTLGTIKSISCTATKEAENDYEITAVVTVKNTDTVNHKYRIKMYDSEGTHLDDEPDELDPKPEVRPGATIHITLTTIGSVPNARTPEILCELYDIKIGADEFIVSETKQCSEVNIGEITNISCSYNKQGEIEYEIEAIVEFKNPDTISHLYKVELLDGKTGESKDWNPGKLSAGKEVAAGASSGITVSTTGIGYCTSPLILLKLWETTGILAVADEQEYDCDADDEESIWKLIADLLGMTVPQVKALATVGGGLLALSFILPLLRR